MIKHVCLSLVLFMCSMAAHASSYELPDWNVYEDAPKSFLSDDELDALLPVQPKFYFGPKAKKKERFPLRDYDEKIMRTGGDIGSSWHFKLRSSERGRIEWRYGFDSYRVASGTTWYNMQIAVSFERRNYYMDAGMMDVRLYMDKQRHRYLNQGVYEWHDPYEDVVNPFFHDVDTRVRQNVVMIKFSFNF